MRSDDNKDVGLNLFWQTKKTQSQG